MTEETRAYRRLQKHLDRMPIGFPPTKSGVEINLLKKIFTPREARVAVHLDYKHKTVAQIFESAWQDVGSEEELIAILDNIVSKGGITRRRREGRLQYAAIPFVLWGVYEQQIKRLDPEFLASTGEYLMGEMGYEMATANMPKMRVIPVEESIEIPGKVATYDELRLLIEQAGEHIAIQPCVCKTVADLQDKQCQTTDRREVCMSFGDLAELYVEEEWGRRITQEEALEMARQSEEEGLVLMPSNEQEPTFMCSCCSDCCAVLAMAKAFPKPAEVMGGNYYVEVDSELCTGVGTCVERCPMEAVALNNGYATVDLNRCIGCGLCVPTCPEKAMVMVKKEQEEVPPLTEEERFDAYLAYKTSVTGRMKNYGLKTFLRVASRFQDKTPVS